MKRKDTYKKLCIYIVLSVGLFLIFVPLWSLLSTSIKPYEDIFIFPPDIIPKNIRWQNYVDIFLTSTFGRFILNSMTVTFFACLGQTASSALVGYGFAKLRFPGRNALFILMISTMMIPYHSVLIPQFLIFKQFSWINTYLPLTVPGFFGTSLYIFLYRQFFINIPIEYNEAATIDGCSHIGVFLRIILPMSLPVVGTVAIMSFGTSWNDFLAPLIYINDMEKMTIQLGINSFRSLYVVQWNYIMAASVVAMMPTVILFAFFQKRMIQGVVVTGVKG